MARAGFNDDQNNPRYNIVPHPYDTDAERGYPAPGKVVQRLQVGGEGTVVYPLEQCTDPDPDPTLYTGGTYTPYAWGDRPAATATLAQGSSVAGSALVNLRTFIDLRLDSGEAGRGLLDIALTTSAAGTAANEIRVTVPELDASSYTRLAGIFTLSRTATADVFGYVNTVAASAPMELAFFRYDGVELGSVLTIASGDILRVNVNVYYSADTPVE